jgi:nitrogen-specific signal transduction histidine kinase
VTADPFDAQSQLAHDLRSLLSIIVGYASLLETRSDDAFRLEAARHIIEAAGRLEDRIDVLDDPAAAPGH